MTSVRLGLPGLQVAVTLPEELGGLLEDLYPGAIGEGSDSRPAHAYELREGRAGWELVKDGDRIATFREPALAALGLEYDLERELLRSRGSLLAIHAGGVSVAGGAVLIAGRSEAGKTTTTFHLVEMGHPHLCEEIALVEPDSLRAVPYPRSLSLRRGFVEELGSGMAPQRGTVRELGAHLVRYVPGEITHDRPPVRTLVFPRYRADQPDRLDTVQAPEVLTEFLGYCFEPEQGEEDLFDGAIRLLEACRIFRLSYSTPEAARRSLREIVGTVSGGGGED